MEEEVLLTKKGKPRKRKPKTKNNYFTQETEEAILRYRDATSEYERNKIYNAHIHHALYKLAENIIHTFKFYYTEVDNIEDLKYELISFMLQKAHFYDQSKGKAYSYFGTIIKRYLIIYNQKNYKKLVAKVELNEVDNSEKTHEKIVDNQFDSHLDRSKLLDDFIQIMEKKIPTMFDIEDELKVAYSLLEIFKRRESINVFNKKAIFIYIKEMNDVQSNTITKVINKLKKLYKSTLNYYIENVD
jgi:hypothetical protein